MADYLSEQHHQLRVTRQMEGIIRKVLECCYRHHNRGGEKNLFPAERGQTSEDNVLGSVRETLRSYEAMSLSSMTQIKYHPNSKNPASHCYPTMWQKETWALRRRYSTVHASKRANVQNRDMPLSQKPLTLKENDEEPLHCC